ncbi:hypothetical protein [Anatilimnocola floriformis]|uniref:hypothetical protein n=1 Tax=Anatilimnocola floriformis TaxID=2948575 RepID=UPI0020C39256|nr:hypothetical protein [Anatilimnocola floriformis]
MFRFVLPVAFASLFVVASIPVSPALADDTPELQNVEPMVVEGAVVSASAGQLSLRTADGKEHSFKPDEKTRINVNGKPGKLEELKAGVQVRVMVDKMAKVVSISTVDDRK